MHKTLYQRNPVKGFIYFQHLHIDFSNKCFYNEHMFEISSDLTTKDSLETARHAVCVIVLVLMADAFLF